MAAESTVARLKFDTVVGLDGLKQGMSQAAQSVKSGMGRIGAAMSSGGGFGALGGIANKFGLAMPAGLSGLGGALGGLAGGPMGIVAGLGAAFAAMQGFASQAKEMGLAANRMGVDVETYQQLRRAAGKSGLQVEELGGGLMKMTKNIFEANNGNAKLSGEFRKIGLNAKDLMNMKPGQQFEAIARGLAKIENITERRGMEMQFFGKSGAGLDPMIQKVGKGGLGQFGSWLDLSNQEQKDLAGFKSTWTQKVPAAAMKAAAHAEVIGGIATGGLYNLLDRLLNGNEESNKHLSTVSNNLAIAERS